MGGGNLLGRSKRFKVRDFCRWTLLTALVVGPAAACSSGDEPGVAGGRVGSGGASGCTPPDVGCNPGETCGPGGICAPECEENADCPAAEYCSTSKVCVPTGDCVTDVDCAPGTFCALTKTCIADGTCAVDGDCSAGLVCDTETSECVPGGGCGQQEVQAEAVAPNMMIVLDRSCSMHKVGDPGTGTSKWKLAIDAINNLTTTFQDRIRWGLILFPDLPDPRCQQGPPAFPVMAGNEPAIQGLLTAALSPNDPYHCQQGPCVTNIDTAMRKASQEPAFLDKTRQSFAVLISDGGQSASCGGNSKDPITTQIITDMFAAGVPTFVIGFTGVNPGQMNIFADAGGVPTGDPTTRYYEAQDGASLNSALDGIAGAVTGCTFHLVQTPDTPDDLNVFLENNPVPRDPTHQNGWDYDPATNQVTFYGAPCDELQKAQGADIDIVFACDQPTPD